MKVIRVNFFETRYTINRHKKTENIKKSLVSKSTSENRVPTCWLLRRQVCQVWMAVGLPHSFVGYSAVYSEFCSHFSYYILCNKNSFKNYFTKRTMFFWRLTKSYHLFQVFIHICKTKSTEIFQKVLRRTEHPYNLLISPGCKTKPVKNYKILLQQNCKNAE